MAPKQNLTNHVFLALDGSLSMDHLESAVVEVADGLVRDLADLSQKMQQETRVSIYLFGSEVRCLVWDMDVLRLPSIRALYRINGNTALCAATVLAIRDHQMIPTHYGDHAVLGFVITDGEENWSRHNPVHSLRNAERVMPGMIASAGENWTIAALVPNTMAILKAKAHGFPAGNIEKWDASSRRGVEAVGERITSVTESWMTGRASGVRGTNNVFDVSAARVNAQTVKAALEPLPGSRFRIVPVTDDSQMDQICAAHGLEYVNGDCFYDLHKPEDINGKKRIIVVEKATDIAYTGDGARDLIGLPPLGTPGKVHVVPTKNPDYHIFVMSTAPNRKPRAGHRALIMLDHQSAPAMV